MNWIMRKSVRFGLILGFVFLQGNAFACSCGGTEDLKRALDENNYIFVAKIVSAKENPQSDSVWNSVQAKFEVSEVIKGEPSELASLYSGYGGGDCGISFLVGLRYLVFTDDGTITSCGATRSLGWFDYDAEFISLLKSYVQDGVPFEFDKYSTRQPIWNQCSQKD